ncbi:MAG: RdgB/HAM1 family non-canonical purine NTP pyrophosphatase [Ruminococcaceae bacterium]|nr:RdgB/HAM1 family non-canonical purine NTP pyrophosphatase [Oscillospiraceae bacterium]
MKAVLASHNKHKIAELQTLLRKYVPDIEILSLEDVGLFGEIVEDGATFEENAIIKARFAAQSGYIGIGDDSGLCVEALGGAPGIYSARYGGEDTNDEKNNAKLISELGKEPNRAAKFVCTIACVFPNTKKPLVAAGETYGEILVNPRGEGGFGYDPLFWVDELGKTYAELTPDEKNLVSHRAKATEKLGNLLKLREMFI